MDAINQELLLQCKENEGKCSTEEGETWKHTLLKAQLLLKKLKAQLSPSGDFFYFYFSVLQRYCPGKKINKIASLNNPLQQNQRVKSTGAGKTKRNLACFV
jgi:hypothetical protein